MIPTRGSSIFLLFVLAACQDAPVDQAGADPISEEQALAARHACASEELLRTAADDLATLEATLGGSGGPGTSVTTFQRAFLQHAQLRASAYAHLDSAMNASPSAADSARHIQSARGMSITPPEPGTVTANVIESYDQKAALILADADHPCNWRHQVER